jgi:hypothetical protein
MNGVALKLDSIQMLDALDLSQRMVVNSLFSPLRVGASLRAIAEVSGAVEVVRDAFRREAWRGKEAKLCGLYCERVRIDAFEAAFEGRSIETIPCDDDDCSEAGEIVPLLRADDPSFIPGLDLHAPIGCCQCCQRDGPLFGPVELARLGVDVTRAFKDSYHVGEVAVLVRAEKCLARLFLDLWHGALLTIARLNGDARMEELLLEFGVEPSAFTEVDAVALGVGAMDARQVVASGNARAARRLMDEGHHMGEFAAFTGVGKGNDWAHVVLDAMPSAQESLGRAARAAGWSDDVVAGGRALASFGRPIAAIRFIERELELGATPSWEAWNSFLGGYASSPTPPKVVGKCFAGVAREYALEIGRKSPLPWTV